MNDIPLRKFRDTTAGLSGEARQLIVQQALRMLSNVYVHGAGELSVHVPPALARLEALGMQSPAALPERMFHDELLAIFRSLRDSHTHYILPRPFTEYVAFLPFAVRDCFEGDERQYVVTTVDPNAVSAPRFAAGVRITHWNQAPIDRVLRERAEKEDGAHAAARHARALASLTVRPAWLLPLPDEDDVVVGYADAAGAHEVRFEWRVRRMLTALDKSDDLQSAVDFQTEAIRQFEAELFPESAVAKAKAASSPIESLAGAGIGYIRLKIFNIAPKDFVRDFAAALSQQPRSGLIIDIRENPGGIIPTGEQVLQLLAPGSVEPTRWQFRATPETRELCRKIGLFAPYLPSLSQALADGCAFSDALPATSHADANAIGQVYQGPILLITDARTYSVGDVFAAGIQDHRIGEVLGTDEATGGGGSNDIAYEVFAKTLPDMFPALPAGASFRISTRRCFRVRDKAGTLIERQGIRADHVHRPTREDRLDGDRDLLERAKQLLLARSSPLPSLEVVVTAAAAGGIKIKTTTRALSRLDLLVNGRPLASPDVTDGAQEHALGSGKAGAVLDVRGFDGDRLVVSRKVVLKAAPA